MFRALVRGCLVGYVLVWVTIIGYDTSGNVASLEGGRAHLVFGRALLYALIGAATGGIMATIGPAAVSAAGELKLPRPPEIKDPRER